MCYAPTMSILHVGAGLDDIQKCGKELVTEPLRSCVSHTIEFVNVSRNVTTGKQRPKCPFKLESVWCRMGR